MKTKKRSVASEGRAVIRYVTYDSEVRNHRFPLVPVVFHLLEFCSPWLLCIDQGIMHPCTQPSSISITHPTEEPSSWGQMNFALRLAFAVGSLSCPYGLLLSPSNTRAQPSEWTPISCIKFPWFQTSVRINELWLGVDGDIVLMSQGSANRAAVRRFIMYASITI